jgi:rhamnulose-1-phosphate aldolase/alcohol dehydrogenase
MATKDSFKYVNHLWNADELPKDPVGQLIYRSNILGTDQRITHTGGGNTSAKITETDPLTGETTEVMWVKGSGGDLRTSKKENFASLYLDKLKSLQPSYLKNPKKGVKSEVEDQQVNNYRHCTFNLNPAVSSIDTPLHAFIPAKQVDHTHPNAAIAIAATRRSKELVTKILGEEIGWVPWMRPGFELGLLMQEEVKKNPKLKGLLMSQHGLINWAEDGKECYELTLSLIERASKYIEDHDKGEKTFGGQKYQSLDEKKREEILVDVLPALRGQVSQKNRLIGTVQADEKVLRFVNSNDAPRLAELGTSCPDHFLRTKIKPMYVAWDPQKEDTAALQAKLKDGLAKYRTDYAAYYNQCKRPDSPAMRDPNPTVILIPGIGMIAWGKTKSESRVTAEFYNCAIEVMRGAEAMDEYIALPMQEAFDIEYWALEEAKLRRMPAEKELARRIVVVVGGGSGIGKSVAHRVAKEGAHVVSADMNAAAAQETADELTKIYGKGIGVAGTGISGCGPAIGVAVDITKRASLQELYKQAILAYGGIDHLIVTAGVFIAPGKNGRVTDEQWAVTFAVNVQGSYNAVDESKALFEAQALPACSVVLTTSVNAVVSKKGSLAYDTSKAAANHLVRELAIECAPTVRVNAIAPATVVEGSTMFPRDRVISSLAKYNIPFDEKGTTEELRTKLANFYAERTLTRAPITPADQAEAAYFLLSSASGKTTGQVISVDGGLHEAFLR